MIIRIPRIHKNNPTVFVGLFLCITFLFLKAEAQVKDDSIFIKGQDYLLYLPSKDGYNVKYEFIKIYDSTYNELDIYKNIKIELKKFHLSSNELSDRSQLFFNDKLYYTFIKPKESSRKLNEFLSFSCKVEVRIKGNKVKFSFTDITIFDRIIGNSNTYELGSNFTINLNGFVTNTMLQYGINEKYIKNGVYDTNNFTSSRLFTMDYVIRGLNEIIFQNINKNIRDSSF